MDTKLIKHHLEACIEELYAPQPNLDRFADEFEQVCHIMNKDVPSALPKHQKPQSPYFELAVALTENARVSNL